MLDHSASPVFNFQEGEILLFNKPETWTSFNVVSKVRGLIRYHRKIKKLKVGHAGTLDPLATGLLIICTGKLTKQINRIQEAEKEYTGTFHLGASTPSFDRETPIDHSYPTEHITEEKILETAASFRGSIEQVPPVYSAIKVKGERAYNYARGNTEVELKSRNVNIYEFEIVRIALPEVDFRIVCSKGTYIRSLARDLGLALDSGAYLKQLTRTRIGHFKLDEALEIEQFEEIVKQLSKNT